jgi:hypothetical protein
MARLHGRAGVLTAKNGGFLARAGARGGAGHGWRVSRVHAERPRDLAHRWRDP